MVIYIACVLGIGGLHIRGRHVICVGGGWSFLFCVQWAASVISRVVLTAFGTCKVVSFWCNRVTV